MDNVIQIYRGTTQVWTKKRVHRELTTLLDVFSKVDTDPYDVVQSFADFLYNEENLPELWINDTIDELMYSIDLPLKENVV
jgi:hypothetical protein